MTDTDRLDEIEARANAVTEAAPGVLASEEALLIDRDVRWLIEQVRKRDNALRAVLVLIDSRGKQAAEALPPSLAALAVPSYQFNVRASDVIRAIGEAFS